jgi:hypothetical protein
VIVLCIKVFLSNEMVVDTDRFSTINNLLSRSNKIRDKTENNVRKELIRRQRKATFEMACYNNQFLTISQACSCLVEERGATV